MYPTFHSLLPVLYHSYSSRSLIAGAMKLSKNIPPGQNPAKLVYIKRGTFIKIYMKNHFKI